MSPHPRRHPLRLTRQFRVLAVAALTAVGLALPLAPAQATPTVTPRNFTGYGFDQCLAPTQGAMDAWLESSPYWAVGIYISGDSRACRSQPNLTPAWISTQLASGWRLLPITLGPQASCNPRFPRYADDETIDPRPKNGFLPARRQARAEADKAVAEAKRLGIGPGSTLWYDMEAYDISKTNCRESALWFTSQWTKRLHNHGYVSGVYSSASSGIKALDDARVDRPGTFTLPDRIWLARWDGIADTSSSYIREDGWRPGNRVKQYLGGHDERYGGVTINIDSNFLDLGKGSRPGPEVARCGGVRLTLSSYPKLRVNSTGAPVKVAQCLLRRAGYDPGRITGTMTEKTRAAIRTYRLAHGMSGHRVVARATWTSLHTQGTTRLVKYGAYGEMVRRLQRALNAGANERLAVTGVFEGTTTSAVRRYQARRGLPHTGVVTAELWALLQGGLT